MFKVLTFLDEHGISHISVRKYPKEVVIKISDISSRKIGLTPHHVGTIVEPPLISRVPPSPDGETYHEFLVGLTKDVGIPFALDCSVAQFGLSCYNNFASDELVKYLGKLGTHRILDKSDQKSNFDHPFVASKGARCAEWALNALKCYWMEPVGTEEMTEVE